MALRSPRLKLREVLVAVVTAIHCSCAYGLIIEAAVLPRRAHDARGAACRCLWLTA